MSTFCVRIDNESHLLAIERAREIIEEASEMPCDDYGVLMGSVYALIDAYARDSEVNT